MHFCIPIWLLWMLGGALFIFLAILIAKKGTSRSQYFGLMMDPFAAFWAGAIGGCGLIGIFLGLKILMK